MNKSTYPLKLPISIKRAAQRLAKEEGVSLNQWIAVAVGQKVGVVDTAAEFFRKRSEGTDLAHMRKILMPCPTIRPMSRIARIDSTVGALYRRES